MKQKNTYINFDLGLVLLITEVNFIAKKQSCKPYVYMLFNINSLKMILKLPIKIVVFYI